MSGQVETPLLAIDVYAIRVEVGMRGKVPFTLNLDGVGDDKDFVVSEIIKALADLRCDDALLGAPAVDRARVVWIHIRNKMILPGNRFPAAVNARHIMAFLARATAR